jgi:uncharacterized Ntn-hydrolase superfamily protein
MSSRRPQLLGTFSIAAIDDASGMLGVAVTSKAFSVGLLCPFARAGAGAVATQSLVNPSLGPAILDLLAGGLPADEALAAALARDPRPDLRQLNVVDVRGGSATFTGEACIPWCGGRRAAGYALAGNILAGEAVVEAMERSFVAGAGLGLADRLIGVLEAGQAAGGDARGKQSAALLVVHRTAVPYLRLQVDDHPEPVAELRRLFGLASEPDPDDGTTMLDFMGAVAADASWTWPVDDEEWKAEVKAAQARLDEGEAGGR